MWYTWLHCTHNEENLYILSKSKYPPKLLSGWRKCLTQVFKGKWFTGVLRGLSFNGMSRPLYESSITFYFFWKTNPIQTWTIFCFVILETYTYLLRKGRLALRSLTNCTWTWGPWFLCRHNTLHCRHVIIVMMVLYRLSVSFTM